VLPFKNQTFFYYGGTSVAVQVLILVISLVALYYGAEFVLDSAEKVGRALGFSPLVIGLVIVGFGTSLPEFFVSHLASMRGEYDIALGNIVGSNMANTLLILGIATILTPLSFDSHSLRDQLIVHLVLTFCVALLFWLDSVGPLMMGILFCCFSAYLALTWRDMKADARASTQNNEEKVRPTIKDIILLNLGFVLLYAGGEMLVSSGSKLGAALGISPYVISAIFVAFGTSLPELVTAVMAFVKKKDMNLITGNIVGSNIFNIGFILGSLGVHRIPLVSTYHVEMSVLLCAAFFLLMLSGLKREMGKTLGVGFLMAYVSMIIFWL
jgi:cation:H+ antiporter